MDTEFTTYNRKDLLLVSGDLVNSLDKYKPVKLEGTPLILTNDNRLAVFKRKNYARVVSFAHTIFNKKPELLDPLLKSVCIELKNQHYPQSTLTNICLEITRYQFWFSRAGRQILV